MLRIVADRSPPDLGDFRAGARRGTSLVEVLVIAAILSLLMALVLPAVQSIRESARRMDCMSRHRQVALAVHDFAQANGHLPGPVNPLAGHSAFPRNLSEWARVLPFLDRSDMYQQIDFDPTESSSGLYPAYPTLRRPSNQRLLSTPLPVVICPSDSPPPGGCNLRVCHGTLPWVNRKPNAPEDVSRSGILPLDLRRGPPRFDQATDGLSHTVMISERLVGDLNPGLYTPYRDVYLLWSGAPPVLFDTPDELGDACRIRFQSPPVGETSYAGTTWLVGGQLFTAYNHVLTPNSTIPDCNNNSLPLTQAAVAARSWHPGGVNAAFGDGSARFISESIDLRVWRALGTRAGGEVEADF